MRRLHDTNKSGAVVALQIVCSVVLLLTSLAGLSEAAPAALGIVVIALFVILAVASIYLLVAVFSDTVSGKNKYGDSEKYPEDLQLAQNLSGNAR